MTEDEKAVFLQMINAEIGMYTWMYTPSRFVCSARSVAALYGWTRYRARKALKGLAGQGFVERVSIGCPAVVSFDGEVYELVCESRPPMNGYALTKQAFDTDEFKAAYKGFERDMERWATESEGEG